MFTYNFVLNVGYLKIVQDYFETFKTLLCSDHLKRLQDFALGGKPRLNLPMKNLGRLDEFPCRGWRTLSVLVTVIVYKSFSRIRRNVQSAKTELLS